jgi:2,3-bisphosphoglycerate-dependent phosphoglycerate mutase
MKIENLQDQMMDVAARTATLVLVRHGQSVSNVNTTFAGWIDSDLTPKGIDDADRCARLIGRLHIQFAFCFCSVLKRSAKTLAHIKNILGQTSVPTISNWRLNECHCGQYTGLNFRQISSGYDLDRFKKWRTVYDFPPPPLDPTDPRSPMSDPLYKGIDPAQLPMGESLEMCWNRLQPFWGGEIIPKVMAGQNILVVTHGNIMRAMRKEVESLSAAEIMSKAVVPNGFPIVYHFQNGKLTARQVLGDRQDRKMRQTASQVI